jgi:outer membrane protein assembly factor BamB
MSLTVRRIFKIVLLVPVVLLSIGFLLYLFGLRVEVDGSGSWPVFHFGTRDSHYAELERSRASQTEPPAPEPPPGNAAAPAQPAPASKPESTPAGYWTDFRGPLRDGVYRQTPILLNWPSKGLDRLWKQPVGLGYASFVVAGGRAFTIEQRRDRECVTAYDVAAGRELWSHCYQASFEESMGGPGPRATPAYDGGLVYSLGATGEFRVLEAATGKLKWSRNILSDNGAQNIQWGMAASPLVVDGKVVAQPGGTDGRSVVAYDKLTGEPVWNVLDDAQAYTTPQMATLAGKRQILTVTAKRAIGLAPEDGKLLWEYPWTTEYDVNAAMPLVVDANHVFLSAGYGHGAALVEITGGDTISAKTVWSNIRMKNRFNHSVLHEGHVYGFDESILACIDVRTGEQKWKGGRYGYGQLLLAGGHLIVTTEQGEVVLVKATPDKLTEVARFQAIEGKTWNVPAIDNGILLVRNTNEMAAFRIHP